MTATKTKAPGRARSSLAGLTLIVPAVLVASSWSTWRASLPDSVACHWDAHGRTDGTFPTEPLFLLAITGTVLVSMIGIVVLLLSRIDPRTRRSSIYWLGAGAAFIAASWLIPAGLTHQSGSARSAHLDGWLAAFLLPFLYGAIPWLLAPQAPTAQTRSPRPVTLRPTEVGAWSKSINTGPLYGVAVAIAALAVVIYVPLVAAGELDAPSVVGLAVMALAVLAVLSFAGLRVTVDWRGLRVLSRLTRMPIKRIPIDRVRAVEVTDLHPGAWGGWGYRVTSGGSAIILRAGPGLVVTTIDGTRFALTLAAPEVPAGLLRTLADNQTPR